MFDHETYARYLERVAARLGPDQTVGEVWTQDELAAEWEQAQVDR